MDLLSTSALCHDFLAQRRYLSNLTPFRKSLHDEGHVPRRLQLQTLKLESGLCLGATVAPR